MTNSTAVKAEVLSMVRVPKPPLVLRDKPFWLLWKYDAGRKVPFYASGFRRSGQQGTTDDRSKLTDFDAALAALSRIGADGLGIATLPEFGVTAVDFDDCLEGGMLRSDVLACVADTYFEFSPSGAGLRAFFRGTLGRSAKSFASGGHPFDVEFFSTSGFVTYTGRVTPECEILGNAATVAELTPAIEALYSSRFGRRAAPQEKADLEIFEPVLGLSQDKISETLKALDPDLPEPDWLTVGRGLHHETGGSAEGCLLWHRWSRGELRGSSAAKYDAQVCEAKWSRLNDSRGSPTTFRTVLAMAKEARARAGLTAQKERLSVRSFAELSTASRDAWIIKGLLPQKALATIYGPSGSGKSFLATDLAFAVATGRPWRERKVEQGGVFIVVAEGAGGYRKRVEAYAKHHELEVPAGLGFILAAPNLLEDQDHELIAQGILEFASRVGVKPALIIIDTLAQVSIGANENSAEDMGRVLANCAALGRTCEATVLLVHHAGKDLERGARGWSGIKAAMDAEIEVSRHGERRVARVTKLKDGEDGWEVGFGLAVVTLGNDADGDPVTSCVATEAEVPSKVAELTQTERAVLDLVSDLCATTGAPASRAQIRRAAEVRGIDKHNLSRTLRVLAEVKLKLRDLPGQGLEPRSSNLLKGSS